MKYPQARTLCETSSRRADGDAHHARRGNRGLQVTDLYAQRRL